jgi:hypothetical protein
MRPVFNTYLEALEHIKKNGPTDKTCGICRSLYLHMKYNDYRAYMWVSTQARDWKHHSGNKNYPVPYKNWGVSDWSKTTREGRLRYQLLNFLIKRARELGV